GDARRGLSATVAVDCRRQTSRTDAGTDQLDAPRLTQVRRCVHGCISIELRVPQDVDPQEPGRGSAIQPKESPQSRIVYVDQAPGVVPDIRGEVRGEIDRQRV